jgi:hypothetical protein
MNSTKLIVAHTEMKILPFYENRRFLAGHKMALLAGYQSGWRKWSITS